MTKVGGMSGVCFLALIGTLCGITLADNSIFSGFLGCRFSSEVCQRDEECVDDALFGNCQKFGNRRDVYQYDLDGDQYNILEGEITRLLNEGFSWEDVYTQCSLGNILLAFRTNTNYDPDLCDRRNIAKEERLTEELAEETLKLLEKYFVEYYDDLVRSNEDPDNGFLADEDTVPVDTDYPQPAPLNYDLSYEDLGGVSGPLEKKDEFVNVHKYLKSHKRPDPAVASFEEPNPDYVGDYDLETVVDNLSPKDIDFLKQMLIENYDYPSYEAGDGIEGGGGGVMDADVEDVPMAMEDVQEPGEQIRPNSVGYAWQGENSEMPEMPEMPDIPVPSGMQLDAPLEQQEQQELPDYISMTPDEARLLGDLLQESAGMTAVKKEQMDEDTLKTPAGESHITVNRASPDSLNFNIPKDPHDHHFEDNMKPIPTQAKVAMVAANYAYLTVSPKTDDQEDAVMIVDELERLIQLPVGTFSEVRADDGDINFKVEKNPRGLNGTGVAAFALTLKDTIQNRTGFTIKDAGNGIFDEDKVSVYDRINNGPKYFVLTFVLCGVIAGIVLAVIAIYIVRRHTHSREKLAQLASTSDSAEAEKDYQDLCRQRMQSKSSEKPEPLHVAQRVGSVSATEQAARSPSSRSSTSSWSEEPVTSNMDISTGHIVLSYMEDHLKNRDRLNQEWEGLCSYEAEPNATTVASDTSNQRKNRYSDVLPYDHSRVVLNSATNVSGSDYINASTITDHDPRNPAYISTQGPLSHTVADFWQMVWEQGSVVLVNLTKLSDSTQAMCHRYWPEEGSDLYHIYEVHLVSEHIWCDDYLVRSFYLKNLQTNETRTVTQFHFLTWTDLGVPASAKSLLDFRRKVNKSYRGRSCPIVVHCSDGSGRTGTYCLIDMVLNRMSKGAKEIDIAATLEHIRDQRMLMVKTKEQFEFALASVAEEVHAILKALPQ